MNNNSKGLQAFLLAPLTNQKNMARNIIYSLLLLCTLSACNDSDDDAKDMTYPQISSEGLDVTPVDCQQFSRGEILPVCFQLSDDIELGSYNIEIHNNFDHHTHSTSSSDCPMDPQKQPEHPWVYNQDFSIPNGLQTFNAKHEIAIPTDIDPGDYHFMIRLTDHAGWQQIHAVAIKIID